MNLFRHYSPAKAEIAARRPIVAGMATMPGRADTFAAAFESIMSQADRLYLYLDGHAQIPEPARNHPRVIPIFAESSPGLRGNGKFLGLAIDRSDCLYLGADDDIVYPPNYVDKLRQGLAAYDGRAIVGYHGSVFTEPFTSYHRSRKVLSFEQALSRLQTVDVLGTGTTMIDTKALRFDVRNWAEVNMLDLNLAIEAARANLPLICLKRPRGFIRPLAISQSDSIYAGLQRDDSRQTGLALQLQALKLQQHQQRQP